MANTQLRDALQNTFLSGLFVGITNLIAQIIFARILGIAIISDYGKIVVIVNIVLVLTSFGINHAVIGCGFTRRRFDNCLSLILLQMALIATIFFFFAMILWLIDPAELERLIWPAILVIIGSLSILPAHAFNVEMECKVQYGKLALIRLTALVSATGTALVVLYFAPSIWVLPIKDFLNGVLFLLMSYLLVKTPIRISLNRQTVSELVRYTKNVWLMNLSSEGGKRIDFAIVGFVLNPAAFGIYFQIRNLVEGVLGFFLIPIRSAVFSYLRQHRDRLDFRQIGLRLLFPSGLAALGGILFSVFFGRQMIEQLLGVEWASGAVMLAPLAIYAALTIYFEVLVSMSKALDLIKCLLVVRFLGICLISLTVPYLAWRFGIEGASWATTGVAIFMLITGFGSLYRRLPGIEGQ